MGRHALAGRTTRLTSVLTHVWEACMDDGDVKQALAQGLHDAQSAMRNFFRLIRMSVRQPFHTRDKLIHAQGRRLVRHVAGAETFLFRF